MGQNSNCKKQHIKVWFNVSTTHMNINIMFLCIIRNLKNTTANIFFYINFKNKYEVILYIKCVHQMM